MRPGLLNSKKKPYYSKNWKTTLEKNQLYDIELINFLIF